MWLIMSKASDQFEVDVAKNIDSIPGVSASQDQPPLNPNGTPQTSRWFDQVKAFTEAMGQPVGAPLDKRADNGGSLLLLRNSLILEEAFEVENEVLDFSESSGVPIHPDDVDKAALTKELADLLYVTYGFAVTFGLPIDEVFERVHRSNMSKLGDDGKPIYRDDGKVLKGPNYQPPKLDDLFNE